MPVKNFKMKLLIQRTITILLLIYIALVVSYCAYLLKQITENGFEATIRMGIQTEDCSEYEELIQSMVERDYKNMRINERI